jgi:hypothetical protein
MDLNSKRNTTLFIVFSILSISASAQGLSMQLRKSKPVVMKGEPKIMKTTETSYGKSGVVKISKGIIEFDKFGLPKSVASLNKDNSVYTVTHYKYDSVRRVELERHIEDKNVDYKTSRVHFVSSYEQGYPVVYQQMNINNVVVSETITKLNDQGQPIMASLYEPQGNLIGYEMAEYFPDRNKVAVTVFDNKGRSLNTDSIDIIRKPVPKEDSSHIKYDQNNNVTWYKTQSKVSSNVEWEYVYDDKGNCIKTTTYSIEVKPNGKEKRRLNNILEREIFY